MSVSERVSTVTRDGYMPRVVFETLRGSPLVASLLRKQKRFMGAQQKFTVDLVDTVQGISFSGLDKLPTTVANDRRLLTFAPKAYAYPITIPTLEVDLNSNAGEDAFLDLVRVELQSAGQKMADELAVVFYGDGTGNSSKNFNGLENIVDRTLSTYHLAFA